MRDILRLALCFLRDLFRTRRSLEAEIAALRHQVAVLQRRAASRPRLTRLDRLIYVQLYRVYTDVLDTIHIIRPETFLRWNRLGFKALWRWKSRPRGGRPKVSREIRDLIRQMSLANPLRGAPRIHGELMMIGIEVAQSTAAIYMAKRRGRPTLTWQTFLRNHADGVASCDFLIVPTIDFKLLYDFLVLGHGRP